MENKENGKFQVLYVQSTNNSLHSDSYKSSIWKTQSISTLESELSVKQKLAFSTQKKNLPYQFEMKINLFIFSLCVFATTLVSCIDNRGKDKPFTIMDHIRKLYKEGRLNEEEITSFKQGIAIAR